jgi:hypothetical protein
MFDVLFDQSLVYLVNKCNIIWFITIIPNHNIFNF